jgi:hypothetical protein
VGSAEQSEPFKIEPFKSEPQPQSFKSEPFKSEPNFGPQPKNASLR